MDEQLFLAAEQLRQQRIVISSHYAVSDKDGLPVAVSHLRFTAVDKAQELANASPGATFWVVKVVTFASGDADKELVVGITA